MCKYTSGTCCIGSTSCIVVVAVYSCSSCTICSSYASCSQC